MTQYNGINRRGASVDKASLSLSPCVCLGFCPPPAPLPFSDTVGIFILSRNGNVQFLYIMSEHILSCTF